MSQPNNASSDKQSKGAAGPYDDVIPENSAGRKSIRPGQGRNNGRRGSGHRILKNRKEEESVESSFPENDSTDEPAHQQESSPVEKEPEEGAHADSKEGSVSKKHRVAIELPEAHRNALDDIKLHLRRNEKLSPRQTSYHSIMIEALERYYGELFPGEEIDSS